jgi:hypothetical protein
MDARRPTATAPRRVLYGARCFPAGAHAELVSRSLERSLTAMKVFNAKRKLKGAVKTVMMTNQLKKVMLSNMVDGE